MAHRWHIQSGTGASEAAENRVTDGVGGGRIGGMRHWPLFGLRLSTPRLELRLPEPDELDALADLVAEGIHDPEYMPFARPWTDAAPAERARSTVQHNWKAWATWSPTDWRCNFAVFADGVVVGSQTLMGRDFAVVREVGTGSWVGLRHHGRGIGTEMRAAVLHLAFQGLGAHEAVSTAFDDNFASLGVSRKLGYRPDGIIRAQRRDTLATEQRLRLSRADWVSTDRPEVHISGLAPCRELFGIA